MTSQGLIFPKLRHPSCVS